MGRRLGRLTLRHCAGLCISGNPAALGDGRTPVSFGHVVHAVRICATRGEQAWRRAVFGGRWDWLAAQAASLRWGRTWLREWAKFDEWMAAEMGCLPKLLKTKGGRLPGTDWVVFLWAALVRGGLSQDEAWETPLGAAAWMRLAWQEADGREVPLLTEELERELLEMGWSAEDL